MVSSHCCSVHVMGRTQIGTLMMSRTICGTGGITDGGCPIMVRPAIEQTECRGSYKRIPYFITLGNYHPDLMPDVEPKLRIVRPSCGINMISDIFVY